MDFLPQPALFPPLRWFPSRGLACHPAGSNSRAEHELTWGIKWWFICSVSTNTHKQHTYTFETLGGKTQIHCCLYMIIYNWYMFRLFLFDLPTWTCNSEYGTMEKAFPFGNCLCQKYSIFVCHSVVLMYICTHITIYLVCNNIKIFHDISMLLQWLAAEILWIQIQRASGHGSRKNGRRASDQVKEVHQKLYTSVM